MQVLMIHNRYGATARGGAERVVERIVAALTARGHAVEVFHRTTVGFGALGRLPAPLRVLWHFTDTVNIAAAFRLQVLLRRTKPDVIHSHNLIGCGGLLPLVIRRSRIPWVHTLHDAQLITPSGLLVKGAPKSGVERSFLGTGFRTLRRWLFGNPTVVASPTWWLLDLHGRYGFFPKVDRVVIGNPTDAHADAGAGPHTQREPAVRRFLFVGQLEGVKGIHVLIEAHRRLRALAPDVVLQIVGDGPLLPSLKRTARDVRGLILRGRLDANGVRSAIAASDVLVVPSLCAENQPSAILEAFALGVPAIASRVGGIPELVRDGETGFLVESGSSDDLVRALRTAVEEPARVRAMASACRAVAEAHAAPVVAQHYEEVYTRAAHRS